MVVFPNIEVAKLLIDCGADVNAQNESKSTPLHVASIAYNYVGAVIIEKKINFRISLKF